MAFSMAIIKSPDIALGVQLSYLWGPVELLVASVLMRPSRRGVVTTLVRGAALPSGVGATVRGRVTTTAIIGALGKGRGGGEDNKCE